LTEKLYEIMTRRKNKKDRLKEEGGKPNA